VPQSKSKRTRYTPPPPKKASSSPLWIPVTMFTMMLTGVVVVITNYLGLLPQGASNNYLFVGLGLLVGGFIMSTQYR
jgi:Cell division protein CrgA